MTEYGVWSKDKDEDKLLKYAVLITYTHTPNIEKVYSRAIEKWRGAQWPLLLILIDLEESKEFYSGKDFKNIQMCVFDKNMRTALRTTPAFPWRVSGTRWDEERE